MADIVKSYDTLSNLFWKMVVLNHLTCKAGAVDDKDFAVSSGQGNTSQNKKMTLLNIDYLFFRTFLTYARNSSYQKDHYPRTVLKYP